MGAHRIIKFTCKKNSMQVNIRLFTKCDSIFVVEITNDAWIHLIYPFKDGLENFIVQQRKAIFSTIKGLSFLDGRRNEQFLHIVIHL